MTRKAYEFWLTGEEVSSLLAIIESHIPGAPTLDRLYRQLAAIDQNEKDWQADCQRLNAK